MSAATMREQLERAFATARTIGEERLIGRALVELQEATDFTEYRVVHVPPEFTLPSQTQRAAVPPVTSRRS